MPDARSGNANGRTQGGSNAEVVIADALVKGLKGIDYELALKAMLKDATVPPGGNEEQEGRGGLVEYNRLGYVPFGIDRAGNRTVEYAYNDYNIATVAKILGKEDIYEEYIHKADNWKNLWRDDYEHDGVKGFIMPRSASGEWLDDVPFGHSKIQPDRAHPEESALPTAYGRCHDADNAWTGDALLCMGFWESAVEKCRGRCRRSGAAKAPVAPLRDPAQNCAPVAEAVRDDQTGRSDSGL